MRTAKRKGLYDSDEGFRLPEEEWEETEVGVALLSREESQRYQRDVTYRRKVDARLEARFPRADEWHVHVFPSAGSCTERPGKDGRVVRTRWFAGSASPNE
jgi:hypothetical protein